MRYLANNNRALDWARDVERMMDGIWGNPYGASQASVDFVEKDAEYQIIADLPGIDQKDINLEIKDDRLSFSTIKKVEKEEKEEESYLIRERSEASYSRTFQLPKGIDHDRIKAELKNGVLTITIPKKPEASPKRIEIK
ncbi:Hsp20/alpha crystallin family protein [Spirochaeta cellobiosiphila]|uniref:Hsp20/alpha crystallin family protein n=1 Tax=Spirochaeta cellobiosiphila TaxID=504483 RepID=UPI0004093F14|nr:Hsp20/alpha crystallin family protein [Spirochaeta cellobiosiphila]